MSKESLIVQIIADASRYAAGLGRAGSATKRFGAAARGEFERLKNAATSLQGQLAGLGITIGMANLVKDTAVFEKEMRQLQVNIGASREEMEAWRKEAYENQKRYGTLLEDQKALADSLQAAGLDLHAVRAAAEPVSKALAVSKTNADQLGKAMGVAMEQFGIDIRNRDAAAELLDKMVVAGRLGTAELENLPDIFARVGGRAKEANFTLDQTLALVETLSKSEPQAERLATLVDSTLRVFTDFKYMQASSAATGVSFFDINGMRRNPIDVLKDIKIAYDRMRDDVERSQFLDAAFGKTDIDTRKGLKKALEDGTLGKIDQYYRELQNARGTIDKDLKEATDNAATQANRLKGALKEAVENGFARPLNDAFSGLVKKMMDSEAEGGWGLSGEQILGGAAASLAGAYVLGRTGKGLLGRFGQGITGTASGVATGKALEHAAGVQPVYVVNMAEGGMGGAGLGDLLGSGKGTAGKAGGMGSLLRGGGSMALAASPLLAMYGVSEWAENARKDTSNHRQEYLKSIGLTIEHGFRKAFGWAGYETQEEKGLRRRAEQLRETSPAAAQDYQQKYERLKATLDGKPTQPTQEYRLGADANIGQWLRKMFGWAGYETQEEKGLRRRAEQLRETSPTAAQHAQQQYERLKAILDGTAMESEAAIRSAGDAVVNGSNAVTQALLAQVGQTKIQGTIGISVTAAPGLSVQTTATGNGNTTLNVGRTNTGAK